MAHDDIAARLGLSLASYWDLEKHDDEAFCCVSLRQLVMLGDILGVSVVDLVSDHPSAPVSRAITPTDVAASLQQRLATQSDVNALSEALGWDVAAALANPDSIWDDWCLDTLCDVCGKLSMDWGALFLHETSSSTK
ncbi:MAG: hypothetical protein ACOY0T_12745 [Myxococcota bacterium]